MPPIKRRLVVFPQPEGPRKQIISPGLMFREMPLTAFLPWIVHTTSERDTDLIHFPHQANPSLVVHHPEIQHQCHPRPTDPHQG